MENAIQAFKKLKHEIRCHSKKMKDDNPPWSEINLEALATVYSMKTLTAKLWSLSLFWELVQGYEVLQAEWFGFSVKCLLGLSEDNGIGIGQGHCNKATSGAADYLSGKGIERRGHLWEWRTWCWGREDGNRKWRRSNSNEVLSWWCQQERWTGEEQTSERKGLSLFLPERDWPEAIQAQPLRTPMTAEACEGSGFWGWDYMRNSLQARSKKSSV